MRTGRRGHRIAGALLLVGGFWALLVAEQLSPVYCIVSAFGLAPPVQKLVLPLLAGSGPIAPLKPFDGELWSERDADAAEPRAGRRLRG